MKFKCKAFFLKENWKYQCFYPKQPCTNQCTSGTQVIYI